MSQKVTLRPALLPEDHTSLMEFIAAEQGAAMARWLADHFARPRYRPDFTRIAEQGDAIIGFALLNHERRRLGAATLEFGFLDDIYVRPDQRGQGIFRALMGECLGALVAQELPFAALHGPTALYAPFGFAPYTFGAALFVPVVASAPVAPLRPVVPEDGDDLAALYAATWQDLPLTQVRAAPDWRWWFSQVREALALEDGRGRVVAYAVVEQRCVAVKLRVVEAAAADAGAARALVAALLARAAAAGLAQLYLPLPPAHRVAQAALQMGGTAHLVASSDQGNRYGHADMAGIVDAQGALAALAPELTRRLAGSRYAGWSGVVGIELAIGQVTLEVAAGQATVAAAARPADVRLRRVSLPALAQLWLGYRAPADLRATGGLDCDDAALGLLDALFPVVMACSEHEDWWIEERNA